MASSTIPCNRKAVTNFSPSNFSFTTGNCYYTINGNMMLITIIGTTNATAATNITLVSDFAATFGKSIARRAHTIVWSSDNEIRLDANNNALNISANTAIANGTFIYGQIIVPIT